MFQDNMIFNYSSSLPDKLVLVMVVTYGLYDAYFG